jgi:hypothetical protein
MLKIVARIQQLLSCQLEPFCKPISQMSEADWLQYEARNREIAELFTEFQPRERVVH